MDVLFHLSDINDWKKLINNIHNLLNVIDTPYKVAIVLNGNAVKKLREKGALEEIHALSRNADTELVIFHACRNALKACDIDEDDLPPTIIAVDAGVETLAIYQKSGFAYIKP